MVSMAHGDEVDRRGFLKAAGAGAATVSIAGCLGGSGNGGGGSGNGGSGGGGGDGSGSGGSGGGQGGTLVYSRGSHSATLDPQNTTSGEDVKVTNQIYNQLIQFVPGETELQSGLATEYDLEGTTATLKLREGVKFTNGEEFTASDFVATYKRFTDSSYQYYPGDDYISAYGAFTLGDWVKSVESKGKYDLTIELSQKYAPFLRNLAMFATSVLSKKAIEQKGEKLAREPVGTGPFELETLDDSGQRIKLAANTEYWGEGPNVDTVIFTTIGENSTRAQALGQGEADVIDGLGTQASKQVRNSGSATLASKQGINVGYMAFNMARKEEFRDKRVRQAISYAIDTKAIVENVFEGFATQASQPIPSNLFGYNENLDPYPHDPKKAQSLLEEAGQGGGFSFELATFQNPRGYNPSPLQAAETVRSNLSEVGITVKVNQQAFDPFLEYTAQGKHDACFLGWYTDNADPDNFYYALLHPGVSREDVPQGQDWVSFDTEGFNTLDVAAWANPEYMKVVTEAQQVYGQSERASKYQQAAKLAYEEAPWVFMDHAKELRGVSNRVQGFVLAPIQGPFLNLVTLKQN
jgi:peptide/nickel transport system substrate-binding protein